MKSYLFLAEGSYCGFIESLIWVGLMLMQLIAQVVCMVCAIFPKGYRLAHKLIKPILIYSTVPTVLGIYIWFVCRKEMSGLFWLILVPILLSSVLLIVRVRTRQKLR
jgi:hypothetical protein